MKILLIINFLFSLGLALRITNFRQAIVNKKPQVENPHKKIYMIDIDGTICHTKNSEYHKSIPDFNKIQIFNELYNEGHEVNYWTARGAVSGKLWDEFTIKQLEFWNVKYSSINMGKPHYDIWIDDKAMNINDVNDINNL